MAIFYIRSGTNQNEASTYSIVKLYFEQANEQASEQANEQANKQADGQTDEHIITKLNLLFNYLYKGEDGSQIGLTEKDRISLIPLLKRIGICVDNEQIYNLMRPERVLDEKIMLWCVKEIYQSPHKVFLSKLTWEKLSHKYLKTKLYITEKPDYKLEEIINYFIVCLHEELEKEAKK